MSDDIESLGEAETMFQEVLRANDAAGFTRMLHDEWRFARPDGSLIDKAAEIAAHSTGELVMTAVTELARDVQVIDSIGVTRVTLSLRARYAGDDVDGAFTYTRTWSRRSGEWMIVATHASVLPEDALPAQ